MDDVSKLFGQTLVIVLVIIGLVASSSSFTIETLETPLHLSEDSFAQTDNSIMTTSNQINTTIPSEHFDDALSVHEPLSNQSDIPSNAGTLGQSAGEIRTGILIPTDISITLDTRWLYEYALAFEKYESKSAQIACELNKSKLLLLEKIAQHHGESDVLHNYIDNETENAHDAVLRLYELEGKIAAIAHIEKFQSHLRNVDEYPADTESSDTSHLRCYSN
ncbi:MAG: hypothetical protein AAGJ37_13665 [Pseudomonadota bacterium]